MCNIQSYWRWKPGSRIENNENEKCIFSFSVSRVTRFRQLTPAPANLHLCTALLEQSAFKTRGKYKNPNINNLFWLYDFIWIILLGTMRFNSEIYNELLVRDFRFFKFKEMSYLRSESHVKAGSLLKVLALWGKHSSISAWVSSSVYTQQ